MSFRLVAPSARRTVQAATVLAVLALYPSAVDAQVVQGQVIDAVGGQPVPQVTVLLLRGERGDTVVTRGLADASGHFALEVAKSGGYRLRCMVIGYQPVTTPQFDLRAGDPPLKVEVRISQVAILLAPLQIMSSRSALLADRWLMSDGYYDRAHHYGREGLGAGRFLDRAAIRQTGAFNVTDIMRLMPGVQMVSSGGHDIVTFRGAFRRCVPPVFVNGTLLTDGAGVNGVVKPSEVAAMEVYTGAITPPEYGQRPASEPCGAIVLWTGNTGQESHSETVPAARELSLDLSLSADSMSRGDPVVATLVLTNRSDSIRTVCITGSHFTLSGMGRSRDIAAKLARHPCDSPIEIAPRASSTWQEIVTLSHEGVGALLLQKRLEMRMTPCGEGKRCGRILKSNWRSLVVGSR